MSKEEFYCYSCGKYHRNEFLAKQRKGRTRPMCKSCEERVVNKVMKISDKARHNKRVRGTAHSVYITKNMHDGYA